MPNKLIGVHKIPPDLWFQCDHIDKITYPGTLGAENFGCGQDAAWAVIQIGELTGNKFQLRLCQKHAQPYIDFLEQGAKDALP